MFINLVFFSLTGGSVFDPSVPRGLAPFAAPLPSLRMAGLPRDAALARQQRRRRTWQDSALSIQEAPREVGRRVGAARIDVIYIYAYSMCVCIYFSIYIMTVS